VLLVATVKSPFDAVAVVEVLEVNVNAPPAASTLAEADARSANEPPAASTPTEVDARSANGPLSALTSTLVVPVICKAVALPLFSKPRVISTSSLTVAVVNATFVPFELVITVKSPFAAVAVVDELDVNVSAPPAASMLAEVDARSTNGPLSALTLTLVVPVI
jgi:hypothetical protein